jgi:hypothetical protein
MKDLPLPGWSGKFYTGPGIAMIAIPEFRSSHYLLTVSQK